MPCNIGSSVSYDSDVQAIFDAFTTPPTAARKTLINTCVLALKTAGVWSKLDVLYMFAAADSQAALINWKDPGTFDATAVNSPTFTADQGFTGDGSTSYIDTNCNPSTAGGNYAQNSASFFAWTLSTSDPGGYDLGSYAGYNTQIIPWITSASSRITINSGGAGGDNVDIGSLGADHSGLLVANRSSATAAQVYRNGSLGASNTSTNSVALADASLKLLKGSDGYYAGNIAIGGAGSSLDGTKQSALYDASLAWLQGIGTL